MAEIFERRGELGSSSEYIGFKSVRLVELNRQMVDVYGSRLFDWFVNPNVAPHLKEVPQTLDNIATYYVSPTLHAFLGFNERGEAIGVFGLREPEDGNMCTLERFVVNPHLTESGWGRSMLQETMRYAFDGLGFDGIELNVGMGVPNDTRTVNFYEASGFYADGLLENAKVIASFTEDEELLARSTVAAYPEARRAVHTSNGWEVVADKTHMSITRSEWELYHQRRRTIPQLISQTVMSR